MSITAQNRAAYALRVLLSARVIRQLRFERLII